MLCERCKKKKTVMFYNENINGRIRSFNLCADCAAAMQQSGELEDMSAPFSAFSSPLVQTVPELAAFDDFFKFPVPDTAAARSCPLCHSTRADLIKERRVGCPSCYTTFSHEIAPLLVRSHTSPSYNGKVPRSHRQKQELLIRIAALRQQLSDAVQAERFESAATLRDQIRDMEQKL